MVYDCIIIGGGPSGAICSLILQKQGLCCLLLEKRAVIDEKICGGFIPDRCRNSILECGVDLSELFPNAKKIEGYTEIRNAQKKVFSYGKSQYGLGTYRETLDSFLLNKTRLSGTTVLYGEPVFNYEKKGDLYIVNGYQGKHIVWATGAQSASAIRAFDKDRVREKMKHQSMGISEIIQTESCALQDNRVYFWYEGQKKDYFWAIPVSEKTWNIGYWTQTDRTGLKEKFTEGRKRWIESSCFGIEVVRSAKGALLGNTDFSECLVNHETICCGDLAGTNNILTGEGIAQAVQSAKMIAQKIINF